MADLRPTTNLVVPEHLLLSKEKMKSKFMYLYTSAYPGSSINFMTSLWVSMVFPSISNDPKAQAKTNRKFGLEWAKSVRPGYLSLKKDMSQSDPHFVASVPLATFSKRNTHAIMKFLQQWYLMGYKSKKPIEPTAQHLAEQNALADRLINSEQNDEIKNIKFTGDQVAAAVRLPQDGKANLEACLTSVRLVTKGNFVVVFADLKITKEEAQQLTSTDWVSLRDIDLYPLLLQWVESGYGETEKAPIVSVPISKIAFTLPPTHVESARVDEDNISISPQGRPFYIPRVIEKSATIAYEDKYSQAGSRQDGSFSLIDINEGKLAMDSGTDPKIKLPVNMPVLVDWLNNKYAFTSTTGNLRIQDLMRFRAADKSHIRTLLEDRSPSTEIVDWWFKLGAAANVSASEFKVNLAEDTGAITLTGDLQRNFERAANNGDYMLWWKTAVIAYAQIGDNPTFSEIRTKHGFPPFAPIARYLHKVVDTIKENIDVVFLKYSVQTVSEVFPWMLMIARYTDDMPALLAMDQANRKAAIEQSVDPKWIPPSIPMISEGFGFLPHQKKVRNLMKDSPDFALFRVQAGGGKSPLIITDVLYEIKANRSQPYLILCPGHLVANYVEEIVYFTGGKLNVIPITNYVIRQNGFARLQAILQSAPRNSVVVADYDTLKYRQRKLCYGTTPIAVFPVIDFLRQFQFGYVALDESHKTKNDTARTRAVMSLITDIKKKRLASGTMAHDSPSDLAIQIATLDPTLFGTREEFNVKYGAVIQGKGPSARVTEWKPGAQRQIMDKIRSRIVDAPAMRKEWAALLPPKEEWIGGVNLTDAQQEVYDLILNEQMEKLIALAKTSKSKKLKKFISGLGDSVPTSDEEEDKIQSEELESGGEDDEPDEGDTDESEGEDLAAMIQPYLSRLEQFLIAPGKDILGSKMLSGDDLLSPKTAAILGRIEAHIFGGTVVNPKNGQDMQYGPFPGKVLVFTNQTESAEEIFERASPRLKACGLLYKAANKAEDGAKFAKSSKVKWMVGVEQSMNEGLNFQFASRLVRCEGVWNPGTLEQGNSRINRPELKSAETRDKIFYDWIVANMTIDITKMARLISKVIAIAKFENSDNAEFQGIQDVPVIKLSLNMLRKFNNWEYIDDDRPGLMTYNVAFKKYQRVRDADYEAYKEAFIAEHGNVPTREPVEVAPTPKDAKLMLRTPYTPGMSVYKAADMGLIRVDEYINKIDTSVDDDDEGEGVEEDEDDDQENPVAQKCRELKGKLVHTEYGDGYVFQCKPNAKHVVVDLLGGQRIHCRKSACFVITRALTNNKDIRNALLKNIGQIPLTTPIDVPATVMREPRKSMKLMKQQQEQERVNKQKKIEEETESALNVEIHLSITNGFLGLLYFVDENNQTASRAVQAAGFRPDPQFYYAKMFDSPHLRNQFKLWRDNDMELDPLAIKTGVSGAIAELDRMLKSGAIKKVQDTITFATKNALANFYRMEHKPNNNKKQFKPYPLIEDATAYLALPIQGQSGTKEAMKFRRPRTKWMLSEPSLSYFGTPQQLIAVMKRLADSGIQVSNIEDLRAEFVKLKKMKPRSYDEVKKTIGE